MAAPEFDERPCELFETHGALGLFHASTIDRFLNSCPVPDSPGPLNLLYKFNHMDPASSKRQTKRDSAKKSKDHSIYTQKSIRSKEALIEKKLSCPTKAVGK